LYHVAISKFSIVTFCDIGKFAPISLVALARRLGSVV